MSWTTPKTWQLNEILTSSDMNTYVSDNMTHLKDNILADYVRLSHTVASGTAGGTATTGSWQTRPINTEDSDASGICTLASNEFTLAAGTYDLLGHFVFVQTGVSVLRLYDVTNAAALMRGVNVLAAAGTHLVAVLQGRFTIASSATLRVEYVVGSSNSTTDLGAASAVVDEEVYAVVELWRVAK